MRRRTAGLLGAAALLRTTPLAAQAWPARPVRIVVPFAPGGGSDVLARIVGQRVSPSWGQPVVVDNRPGAGGILGADLVAKAPADGYTLLVSDSSAVTMNPSLYARLPYAARDLTPVVHLATFSLVIMVPPNSPIRSLADLVAADKARPGSLNVGTAGNGTSPHLVLEMFNNLAGTKLVHVPYRGGGPANTAFLTGELDALFNGLSANTAPIITTGRGRAIAVTTPNRIAALPDVPTMAEAGFPGFEAVSTQTLFAPAGVPLDLMNRLNADVSSILEEPEVVDLWAKSAYLPVRRESPGQIAAWLASETDKWARVVREARISLD
ncbi:Bug family tripartite tricarboxylate transporter substrate binding protein [Muricoccus vinaceus]|uniref:Bug family tripartite tricarboxylate transporter substrate binding protein n=1 Tax=Muricoccus vinaceus TaxID=424704 RepID=A0ABV6IUA3_9PROT